MKSNLGVLIVVVFYLVFHSNLCAQKDSLSFLALGDSYTVGTSESYSNSWPILLQGKLAKKKILLKKPKIIADAGWTTQKLIHEMDATDLSENFDLVSLLIGVNNQYRNQSIEAFQIDLITLLNKSIALANNDTTRVFVVSIPDWSVTPFARFKAKHKIAKQIDAYNAIIAEETLKRKLRFINITKLSRKAKYDTSLLAKDSLHPSKRMYKEWVAKISKAIKTVL